jgi:hypothetical protein
MGPWDSEPAPEAEPERKAAGPSAIPVSADGGVADAEDYPVSGRQDNGDCRQLSARATIPTMSGLRRFESEVEREKLHAAVYEDKRGKTLIPLRVGACITARPPSCSGSSRLTR